MSHSAGAVDLPTHHLSVRVAWHDTDWTGRVCADPAANHACSVLKNIKEKKDADREASIAGSAWADGVTENDVPPCALERAGFMRPHAFTVIREHAYAKRGRNATTHGHFRPTPHRMPAYSFEAVPFRWTNRESAAEIAVWWDAEYDERLFNRASDYVRQSD